MTRGDAVEHAAEMLLVVDEMAAEGCDLSEIMVVTGIGGDTAAGRRQFRRWLERHGRLDLVAHFEKERQPR